MPSEPGAYRAEVVRDVGSVVQSDGDLVDAVSSSDAGFDVDSVVQASSDSVEVDLGSKESEDVGVDAESRGEELDRSDEVVEGVREKQEIVERSRRVGRKLPAKFSDFVMYR